MKKLLVKPLQSAGISTVILIDPFDECKVFICKWYYKWMRDRRIVEAAVRDRCSDLHRYDALSPG